MLERRLPNLDLLELIGIGGAAEVYRALDANGRQVAVKILSERAEDDLIKRFLREGRVLSGLHHPHIVAIHEMGEAHGLRYLVMELVEGGSLKERLEAGPLPWPEAVEIARQIADALGYAHRRGIVHRDVKPGNIMFTADGSAKLADFGLAHLSDASAMTRTGTIMGTVFYLAPEQCLGHPIDARADLYALGAVLYEMLVGQPPFVGPTAVSIIYKHLNEQPPPLRDRDPSLPPLLEAIVSRLLQKDPSRRFPDAEALIDALAQVDHVSTNALPAEEAVAFILSPAESGQRDKGYLETGAELPLVGRAELFDALIAALDDACAGLGTTVLLAGEAGMGKTRLIHELMREAQRRNVLALCGECLYADAPDPYAPFVSMLRRFEEQGGYVGLEQSGGETASRKQPLRDVLNDLRAILRLGGALEPAGEVPLAGRARWLAQESPRDAQAHFFELIVQFFLLLSQERPLLLILDDLQWAGETVAQLFHYLARSLSRSRILLLGAYRPEEIRSNAEEMPLREVLRRMSREHLYREERLQALSCDDVASMLAMVLWPSGEMGAKVMPREFVYLLHRESEGNPFFLLEMLR
ncbi:MAG: protein kinase, partial [Chloroflexi bacterium]|nr:protein kinase [Chloroflexota bacterium]